MSHIDRDDFGRGLRPARQDDGNDVYLNVYDQWPRKLNNFLRRIGLGGLYHTEIGVCGREFSFSGKGLRDLKLADYPAENFREQIYLGKTRLSLERIRDIRIRWGGKRFRSTTFRKCSHNCNHFSEDFAEELGLHNFPRGMNRFACFGLPRIFQLCFILK